MSLAQTTMLPKLTWQFGLLQHELILTYIFEKNKTSLMKAENAGNWDSAATVTLFCQMTIKDLITEGDPSYGTLSLTTGKPSGAGKSSSCIHTAQKTPWSLPPLTFPEHVQGTSSYTLPQ